MKTPISETLCSKSALVPHDPAVNDALNMAKKDYGLKPNGITIDMMRETPELFSHADTLDKAAIAAKSSSSLAEDVKKVVRTFKKSDVDRNFNKQKFI